MSRYGDTPAGMVEATMEFLRLCKKHDFDNVVVSLKSSNTRVMVQAYRLLVQAMDKENMSFCLHLGVTEAGSAEDGRIKSAVGIGTLMSDGIGDTIRVSLTEHPAKEIPVAQTLVAHFKTLEGVGIVEKADEVAFNAYAYEKRKSQEVQLIGGSQMPVVIGDLSAQGEIEIDHLLELGFIIDESTRSILKGDLSPDIIYTGESFFPYKVPDGVMIMIDCHYWDERVNAFPLFSWDEYNAREQKSDACNFVQMEFAELDDAAIDSLKQDKTAVIVCYSRHKNGVAEQRAFINKLMSNDCHTPVIIQRLYRETSLADFQLKSAADNGSFFIDGLGDGLWLKQLFKTKNSDTTETAFSILQAARTRTTKTEYISCPGCGRTLFDLEKTLAEVKASTEHLKGLKIAVMGCIVNGPGEMADADYGYVGAGPGKVSLYKGKEVIKRNIDADNAVQELLGLINASC
jgi:(E)-4-hydroxy-3-methylbut-2-enyl-diphosphate synthase